MSGDPLRIEIDAGAPGEPIQGRVDSGSGGPKDFSGWIELVAVVEAARTESTVKPEAGQRRTRLENREERR